MGFEAPARRQVRLTFDGDLAGLEVTVRAANESTFRAAAKLAELSDTAGLTTEDAQIIVGLFDAFARALVNWNLTSGGVPVPPTRAGIDDQEDAFIIQIILGWLSTVRLTGSGRSYETAADADLARGLPVVPLPA